MNRVSNLLWGLVFVTIGIILGLNALEITNINIFFDGWWTFIIIIPCFIDLFNDKDKSSSIIGIIIGTFLLLSCQNIIDFVLLSKLIVPTILVIIGLSFIFKDTIDIKVRKKIKKLNKKSTKEYCSTFSRQTIDFADEEVTNCNLDAIFGGIKCNLNKAIIKDDIVINASAIFGGITIYVPEDVNIKITSTPIFGGVSDARKNKLKTASNTIYINAICMFGGVEIK